MDSPAAAVSPALTGQLLLILITATPLAFVTSLVLLRLYLRAVTRSMHQRAAGQNKPAGREPSPEGRAAPPDRPLTITLRDASASVPAKPEAKAVGSLRMTAAVYILAGLVFASVMTASYLALNGLGFYWLAAAFLLAYYAWPIVMTLSLIAAISWRQVAAVVVCYGLVIAAIGSLTTVSVRDLASVWFNGNAEGTVLALLFLARPIRAVGPLVAAFMVAAVAGAIITVVGVGTHEAALYWVAAAGTALHLGGVSGPLVLLLAGAALASIVGWICLRWLGRAYQSGRISDQSIMLDAVWLMFAIEYGIGLAQSNVWGLFAALVAFLDYKAVSTIGLRRLARARPSTPSAPALLLLRVFSLGRRSEHLFAAFAKRWRYAGTIRMIAGPDLAATTVEPHEFLEFASGRLNRRFISDAAELTEQLATRGPRRDFDGRFRTASFFCHDDTWQMVLRHLAETSDAVLMDLRGFTRHNLGCAYEIGQLLDAVPLSRILILVDGSTDEAVLNRTLAEGWQAISRTSPNLDDRDPRIVLYRLNTSYGREVPALVALLASARGETAPLSTPDAYTSSAPVC
jgi:hypothetical protein